jgi:hypothetical protein
VAQVEGAAGQAAGAARLVAVAVGQAEGAVRQIAVAVGKEELGKVPA